VIRSETKIKKKKSNLSQGTPFQTHSDSIEMVNRMVLDGLRCTTSEGVFKVRVTALFSDSFVDELSEYDDGVSLESTIDELLAVANRVSGGSGQVCPSVYGRASSVVADVDQFGVDAIIDMQEAKGLAAVMHTDSLSKRASVRDALLCYAGAFVTGGACGARLEPSVGSVGVKLVEDGTISPVYTMQELLSYWRTVKSEAGERARRSCGCVYRYPLQDGNAMLQLLSSAEGKASLEDPRGLRYEILSRGKIQRHDPSNCSALVSNLPGPYAVALEGLKAAVSPGYDRWLHDEFRVCCTAKCSCWKYGVREAKGVGWYVVRQFLCDGRFVCGTSELGRFALGAMGLRLVRSDAYGLWYEYSGDAIERWLESVVGNRPQLVCGDEIIHWTCALLRVRMLRAWFDYIDDAKLSSFDVLCGARFDADGLDSGREWFDVDGVLLAGQYQCVCGNMHN